jgi:TonB family protein
MTATVLTREFATCRIRTRKSLAVSFIVHLLLLAWLVTYRELTPAPPQIVEITWLEPESSPSIEPSVVVASAEVEPRQPAVSPPRVRPQEMFRREPAEAQVDPRPQTATAQSDKMRERLASLRQSRVRELPNIATPSQLTSPMQVAAASAAVPGSASGPRELVRGQTSDGPPLDLRRDTRPRSAAALAAVPTSRPARSEAAVASESAIVTRQLLEGVQLAGPVADRPVQSMKMPVYPAWATREAIEATVTLYFVVLPDGVVKENVQVRKTAGYADFDRNATAALQLWRFAPLEPGVTKEQWGTITFQYRLRDGNS